MKDLGSSSLGREDARAVNCEERSMSSSSNVFELGATMSETEALLLESAAMHEEKNNLHEATLEYQRVLQQNPYNVR